MDDTPKIRVIFKPSLCFHFGHKKWYRASDETTGRPHKFISRHINEFHHDDNVSL